MQNQSCYLIKRAFVLGSTFLRFAELFVASPETYMNAVKL